jgi:primosomal protein N' (replication factor Y) (superfamily II helicase)
MPDIILKIAVPVPLNQVFDFLPHPSVPQSKYQIGCRVAIPFGPRRCVGIITEITNHSDLALSKLKSISKLLDNKALLSEEIIALVKWSSNYYHYPIGEVFQQVLPVLYRKPEYNLELNESCWRVTRAGSEIPLQLLSKAKRQQKLLQLLQQNPQGLMTDEINQLQEKGWQAVIKRLESLAYVSKVKLANKKLHSEKGTVNNHTNKNRELKLNDEQAAALGTLKNNNDRFYPCLLDGVTGSGKTEVYLQFISLLLEKNKQVLVLVPEINLTPQLSSRFEQRFNTTIVILHSSISKKQRLTNWLKAGSGQANIVIGTRSAIFTPMPHLGAIILDEEHDLSFKQQDGFRYNARDLAIFRAKLLDIPVLLGSATPSLESLSNVSDEKYHYLRLKKRAANAHSNKFTLLDVRNKLIEQGISHELKSVMQDELEKNNQILLFQNRRGYSPTLFCHHCGWVARCPSCDSNLTLHSSDNYMLCHHCENKSPIPQHCLSCDSSQVDIMGAGTQRIEETMHNLFPDIEVLRIDRDSTRLKGSFEKIIEKINQGEKQILVGTQMLSKGHHFPNVTLVVILDVDQGLFSCDFRALEKMAQSIVQVAGRAGRAEKPGHVVLQTHQPEHPFFSTLLHEGYSVFASNTLTERKAMGLPPYHYMALLRSEAKDQQHNQIFLNQCMQLAQSLPIQQQGQQDILDFIQLLGPVPSPMERRGGFYRSQILIQSAHRKILQQFLEQWLAVLPKDRRIKWTIDIDPLDMS